MNRSSPQTQSIRSFIKRIGFAVLATVLISASFADAASTCSSAITPKQGQMGSSKTTEYDLRGRVTRLKTTSSENQRCALECYLFNFVEGLETFNENHADRDRQNLDHNSFSSIYLYARKIQVFVEEMLKLAGDPSKSDGLSARQIDSHLSLDGGNSQDVLMLMNRFGVVFDRHMKPLVPFEKWNLEWMNRRIRELMDVEFSRLKQTRGSWVRRGIFDQARFDELAVAAAQRVFRRTVGRYVGELPDPDVKLTFAGQSLTPREIEAKYGFPDDFHIHSLYVRKRGLFGDRQEFMANVRGAVRRAEQMQIEPSSIDEMTAVMRRAIDSGNQVQVSVRWTEADWDGYHVMTLVGYEVDRQSDKVISWLFKNTWGNDYGARGEAFFRDKDLRENLVDLNLIMSRDNLERVLGRSVVPRRDE